MASRRHPRASLASDFGLRANTEVEWEDDCLFVTRFDRRDDQKFGIETVASLLGIKGFGYSATLQQFSQAIVAHCTNPLEELAELFMRDIFNLAVGNVDNHVRNTSVLKTPDGRIALSPLYDVAPMILDRRGIPRTSRWGRHEKSAGDVNWAGVLSELGELVGYDLDFLHRRAATAVACLPEQMVKIDIDLELRERLKGRQQTLSDSLGSV